tara:strand:+ start:541 stop:2583 length:2043 start_codon:yes stop_codon:yes gene_type:complete
MDIYNTDPGDDKYGTPKSDLKLNQELNQLKTESKQEGIESRSPIQGQQDINMFSGHRHAFVNRLAADPNDLNDPTKFAPLEIDPLMRGLDDLSRLEYVVNNLVNYPGDYPLTEEWNDKNTPIGSKLDQDIENLFQQGWFSMSDETRRQIGDTLTYMGSLWDYLKRWDKGDPRYDRDPILLGYAAATNLIDNVIAPTFEFGQYVAGNLFEMMGVERGLAEKATGVWQFFTGKPLPFLRSLGIPITYSRVKALGGKGGPINFTSSAIRPRPQLSYLMKNPEIFKKINDLNLVKHGTGISSRDYIKLAETALNVQRGGLASRVPSNIVMQLGKKGADDGQLPIPGLNFTDKNFLVPEVWRKTTTDLVKRFRFKYNKSGQPIFNFDEFDFNRRETDLRLVSNHLLKHPWMFEKASLSGRISDEVREQWADYLNKFGALLETDHKAPLLQNSIIRLLENVPIGGKDHFTILTYLMQRGAYPGTSIKTEIKSATAQVPVFPEGSNLQTVVGRRGLGGSQHNIKHEYLDSLITEDFWKGYKTWNMGTKLVKADQIATYIARTNEVTDKVGQVLSLMPQNLAVAPEVIAQTLGNLDAAGGITITSKGEIIVNDPDSPLFKKNVLGLKEWILGLTYQAMIDGAFLESKKGRSLLHSNFPKWLETTMNKYGIHYDKTGGGTIQLPLDLDN